ncbi:MAG: CoA-binding protein [Bacteroidetes bacterium]|nr:CoA-binding protein [Bacteroidota bacterium]MCH8032691.1 CoA-binding protein [Bacteroidota bacterium]
MKPSEFPKIISHRGHLTSLPENAVGSIKKVLKFTPKEIEKVLLRVHPAGIEKVWMQQGSQSKVVEEYCSENEIDCISNECILMFTEPAGFIHRAHRWVKGDG